MGGKKKNKQQAQKVLDEEDSGSDVEIQQTTSAFSAFNLDDMEYESDMSSEDSEAPTTSTRPGFDFGDEESEDAWTEEEEPDEPEPEPEPEPAGNPDLEERMPPANLKGKALKNWKKKEKNRLKKAKEAAELAALDDFADESEEEEKAPAEDDELVERMPPANLSGKARKNWKKKEKQRLKKAQEAAELAALDDMATPTEEAKTKAPAEEVKEEVKEEAPVNPDLVERTPPSHLKGKKLKNWRKKERQRLQKAQEAAELAALDSFSETPKQDEPEPTPEPEPEPEVAVTEEKEPTAAEDGDSAEVPAFVETLVAPTGLSKKALKKWRQKNRDALNAQQAAKEAWEAKHGGGKKEPEKDAGPVKLSAAQKKRLAKKRAAARKEEEKKAADAKRLAALKERMRKQKEAEERARLEEEARIKAEEEAEAARIAEEERQRVEAERKREARLKRRAEMKKQGLLLTKKQRQQKQRAAERLAAMKAAGMEIPQRGAPQKRNWKPPKKKKKDREAERSHAQREAQRIRQELAAEEKRLNEEAKKRQQDEAEALAQAMEGLEGLESTEEESGDSDLGDWDADSDEEAEKAAAKEERKRLREEKRQQILEARRKRDEEIKQRLAAITAEKKAREEAEAKAKKKAEARLAKKEQKEKMKQLRSPICCILGHVDTGKTKILDYIRRTNVQEREAGGITQQIGATYFPVSAIKQKTKLLNDNMKKKLEYKLPGLLIIDTPGHASFTNLRSRGSSLCDIAILVVDITHALEPQTIESIQLLRQRKTPFIVALNKVDRLYGWDETKDHPIRMTLENQPIDTKANFDMKVQHTIAAFAGEELNTALYWENKNMKKIVSLVPTSAHTGEGIPDLLMLMTQLTQNMMSSQLTLKKKLQCTVLEVKQIEGLGTTIDVVIVNGLLREGQQIVMCGLQGPIVTTIRALLTPHPMKESRVNGAYIRHREVKAAMGVKICAQGLEHAVAGGSLLVCNNPENLEELKDEVMYDLQTILQQVDTSGVGVYVVASTLGSLEALLAFLKESKIPVANIALGTVSKRDVIKASVMLEHQPEYATILAFDVNISDDAKRQAELSGVKIFPAKIIYHLFDKMTEYMAEIVARRREETKHEAVFPCILEILPQYIFNNKNPIIMGVRVEEGILKVGTPLCCPSKNNVVLGYVSSIEFMQEEKQEATQGQEVSIKIEPTSDTVVMYGRQFDHTDKVYSLITRRSIDVLKENFKDEMTDELWRLIIRLKRVFNVTVYSLA